MGKRTTATERAAVESTAARIKGTYAQAGREISAEEARRKAVRLMEKSDAERREGKRK